MPTNPSRPTPTKRKRAANLPLDATLTPPVFGSAGLLLSPLFRAARQNPTAYDHFTAAITPYALALDTPRNRSKKARSLAKRFPEALRGCLRDTSCVAKVSNDGKVITQLSPEYAILTTPSQPTSHEEVHFVCDPERNRGAMNEL
jgi:hypothetical protein